MRTTVVMHAPAVYRSTRKCLFVVISNPARSLISKYARRPPLGPRVFQQDQLVAIWSHRDYTSLPEGLDLFKPNPFK